MNVLFLKPEGHKQAELMRDAAHRLRALGHSTITINPAGHRRNEMYGGMDWLVYPDSGWIGGVVVDYRPHVKNALELPVDADVQSVVDTLLADRPREVPATEGLPVAPQIVPSAPHGSLDGLPAVPGSDLDKPSPLAQSELPNVGAVEYQPPTKTKRR